MGRIWYLQGDSVKKAAWWILFSSLPWLELLLPPNPQGRVSGTLQRYSLPKLALESKHILNCRPHKIALNSTSKLAKLANKFTFTHYSLTCIACLFSTVV